MNTYAIVRRHLATPEEISAVDRRSQAELDRRPDELRKLRSYVFEEEDGTLGTICVYQAKNPDVIRDHGERAEVRVDEILDVTAIDVHRPDPERVSG